MSLLSLAIYSGVFLSGCVLAACAHELAHAGAALLVGGRVNRISFLEKFVDYEVPTSPGNWRERVVLGAPLLSGLPCGVLLASVVGMSTNPWTLALWMWWAIYTVWGSRQDYSVGAARAAAA